MVVMETPESIKQEQQELINTVTDNGSRELEVVYDKDRDLKVPLKVGLRKEVQLSDLPVMWLFALGNLSIKEYNDYLKDNEGKLSINEIAASDLLAGVLKKDSEALKTYWRLNERMLTSGKGVKNQVNINIKPNAVMSELLSSIEGEIFGVDDSNDTDV